MNKGKLLEKIREVALSNGLLNNDDLGKLSLRSIEISTALLYADALMMIVKKESDLDFFTKSYNNVSIDYNHDTKQYTSDLPCKIVQLPNNNGVRVVKGIGSNRIFAKSNYTDIDLFSDMDASKYYDRTLYVMEGQTKIRYTSFDYAQHNVRFVMMKLIPDFMEYTYNEDVPIPSGRSSEFVSIISKQLFQNNKFKDISSDGN